MFRALIFVHRWLGVALCVMVFVWFTSGIGMMYWDFPDVSPADRLARSPALDEAMVIVSPADALTRAGVAAAPTDIRLNTFDGRPVYRFRTGRRETVVYADTGNIQEDVSTDMVRRAASAWTGLPSDAAHVTSLENVDQWTVQGAYRNMSPLWKYSWPNGEQVYVSEMSGEVVQYTTTASRLGAYLGPIPHWIYFTPLRTHSVGWSRVVIWSSGLTTLTAIVGLTIALWVSVGRPLPYRGTKRWHAILGLIFGVAATTWAFSGLLSMDPFPFPTSSPSGERRPTALAQALRGRLNVPAFSGKGPREVLRQLSDVTVKQLEWTLVGGEPAYLATLGDGRTRVVPVAGAPQAEFDRARLTDLVTRTLKTDALAEVRELEQYDRYYLDRRRELPLPVLLARMDDAEGTRYYIDPKTAKIVGSYSGRGWITRWLYHGLHSLNFPWLYNYRPAWDIVMIAFMIGGASLSATSVMLAWRVVGRRPQSPRD